MRSKPEGLVEAQRAVEADPTDGQSYITKISNETMRQHHELGLMRMALQLLDD